MKMNRWVKKIALSALSALPLATVALAAESKLLEMAGEDAQKSLPLRALGKSLIGAELQNPAVLKARLQIFPPLTIKTSWQSALVRFKTLNPSLSGAEIDLEFEKTIQILKSRGLITTDEKEVVSHAPSYK